MPNHWESSARPLFIKTVFVNGSRHAILFEKDPLIRCVNSPQKKTSRPNSSLSFSSSFSISSSEESQNSEYRTFRLGQNQRKDLSSELQSCLVKFKLASNGLKNTKKSGEKCFYNWKAKENSKQKTQKENRNKRCDFFEENEHKLTGTKITQEKSCYIYNLENYKRRKNYSFVKITSQSPKFLLNCSCENDWKETPNCNQFARNKKNFVISASIQNLVMAPTENENLIEKTFDYVLPFENSELHWNYLTKSYYSSLAERVFQWLDLTRKRKKPPGKPNFADTCDTNSERICSGEKFAKEIKRNVDSCKSQNKLDNKKSGKHVQSDTSEEEIEEKVLRESNVETLLSSEKSDSRDIITEEMQHIENLNFLQNSSSIEESSPLIFNVIRTPLKIQDLFVNLPSEKTTKNHEKRKDHRKVPSDQNTDKETSHSEEERYFSIIEKSDFTEKSEIKHLQCYCNRNLDKYGDDISSQILTEEFAERNQKSINTLNNTRTKPVLIQNLSPQQHDKISSLEEEKIIWASEKKTGKPQLHIFMPSILLKDQSDDSMSECENFFNL